MYLKRKLPEQLSFEIEFVRNEKYVRQTLHFILNVTRFEGAVYPHRMNRICIHKRNSSILLVIFISSKASFVKCHFPFFFFFFHFNRCIILALFGRKIRNAIIMVFDRIKCHGNLKIRLNTSINISNCYYFV